MGMDSCSCNLRVWIHSYRTEVKELVIFVAEMEIRNKLTQNL